MKNKFDFYDIVLVFSKNPALREINKTKGVVLGMSQNEETGEWGYAVSMYSDEGYCWSILEEDLVSTGLKGKEEDFKTGETVKISVDPKTGEGKIVAKEP